MKKPENLHGGLGKHLYRSWGNVQKELRVSQIKDLL